MAAAARAYDLVLLGATGFTGQLIAQYLQQHSAHHGYTWAIAGRDITKLQTLAASLGNISCLTADVNDPDSLRALTQQTTLLINTVGPFNWYGKKVVAACAATQTHYIDITGEPEFVTWCFQQYHETAKAQRQAIVNCCGFDSIPADYAAWLTARALPAHLPKDIAVFIRTNATFSGGTWTTAINALHQQAIGQKMPKLSFPKDPRTPRVPLRLHYHKTLQAWAIPMPVVDPHIVKRSIHFFPQDYGAAGYRQYFLRSSFWKMLQTVVPILLTMVLVRFAWYRNWLFAKAKPGTGPDAARRARSYFEVIGLGEAGEHRSRVCIKGGDPGYNETAKMVSEAAFCLLEKVRTQQLPYGVLTPVQAFGKDLQLRLEKAGIQFETIP